MLARQSKAIGAVLFTADLAAVVACFLLAFLAKKHLILPDPSLRLDQYASLLAIEVPFIMPVLALNGLYLSKTLLEKLASQALIIIKATIQILAVVVLISFYTKLFSYSRGIVTLFCLLLPFGLMTNRAVLMVIRRLMMTAPGFTRRILVFGVLLKRVIISGSFTFVAAQFCVLPQTLLRT